MAGAKSFDPDEALDNAMRLFWSRGYDAVAVSDLEDATGLNRSSLYNAFGSKEQFYVAVLERYSGLVLARILPPLNAETLPQAIGGMLQAYREFLRHGVTSGGCLISLASYETGAPGKAAALVLNATVQKARDAIIHRYVDAVSANLLAEDQSRDLASLTLSALAGLATLSRLKAPDPDHENLIGALVRNIESQVLTPA